MIKLPDWWAETWSAGRLAAWTPRVLLDDPDQVVQGDRACSTCTTRSGADRPSSPPTARPARMPTGLRLRELVRRRTGGPPRDAVLSPGEVILLLSWLDYSAADAFRTTVTLHGNADSARFAWSGTTACTTAGENPEYYPEVARP